jgi:hypothetical protein
MDLPANREDPSGIGRRSCRVSAKCSAMEPPQQFPGAWPFSPDLRHFTAITAALRLESIDDA